MSRLRFVAKKAAEAKDETLELEALKLAFAEAKKVRHCRALYTLPPPPPPPPRETTFLASFECVLTCDRANVSIISPVFGGYMTV